MRYFVLRLTPKLNDFYKNALGILCLSLVCFGASPSFANCDARHLLTRLSGAIESGAIDGSLLTNDARNRFIASFLMECPSVRQNLKADQLDSLLEKVTGGWEADTLYWKSVLKSDYLDIKKAGLVSSIVEVDEVLESIESNPDGICGGYELVVRFVSIGQCSSTERNTTWVSPCVVGVNRQKSEYVKFKDLCPQIKLSWEEVREVVVASSKESGRGTSQIPFFLRAEDAERIVERNRSNFKRKVARVVQGLWDQWGEGK